MQLGLIFSHSRLVSLRNVRPHLTREHFYPVIVIFDLILTFELDLHRVKMNQHARYVSEVMSFESIVRTHKHPSEYSTWTTKIIIFISPKLVERKTNKVVKTTELKNLTMRYR